ncbi:rDNA-binding RNA polymerase I transcriptional factor KNAG_0A06300 [Huiozyma naganishii CBS 8797]|uniref:RNA polymerase I-specific transcription initiation factor RRN3 n=1 Tax=Huiozyma naganishii (strain ATCC MYA-139 / BCRC 22969 / CBS 8797 / KCTC 17520 / NBRC 10181 / NCYC 3082 / Yp74L-3) TaxID=1071383 RepID=J7S3Z3_HUIN7|nr:hypothetical protein KNAG_0A06300 [Kazachstania naganishii CBS 8797]CCK68291.1 hypothetical protein KNAG_0A06300 [Kazachstania naganishii CBS 8797]
MMAFENTAKRPSTKDTINPIEAKKRKVEFANDVTLYPLVNNAEERHNGNEPDNDVAAFSSVLYSRYVHSALAALVKKDTNPINVIANQLALPAKSSDGIKPENLNILLDALSSNINSIDSSKGAALIQALINFDSWWNLPNLSLNKYISFIRILCSSIPKWWQDVSHNLISNFGELPLEETKFKHHELLNYFIKVIPSSMGFIDSYLVRFFPNKNAGRKNLINYTSNVLYLTSYCRELRFQVWSLIVEKAISIDVELQNELDEMDDDIDDSDLSEDDDDDDDDEDDEDDDDDDAMSDVEGAGKSSIEKGMGSKTTAEENEGDLFDPIEMEDDEQYNVEVTQSIKELSSKLDDILALVSNYITREVTPETLELGEGIDVFNTLTTLFKTHVLPTYYTRSVQYIMFHVSQQQLELMDSFLVTLIDISFSPNETVEKKIKSLQYLGSYIARAKKLSRTQIIFVASYLTSWLNRYAIEREEEVNQPGGMERFKHFYAAFQALCYVFCFRRDMFRDLDGNWECELDKFFQRMIISKFNPLKYCNENVMLMFARITQHEDIAYCFSIIENNNHERLRGIVGKADLSKTGTAEISSSNGSASTPTWSLATRQQFIDLQSYFPYDPLFLKNYKGIMRDYFIEWSEVSGDLESDHDSDD